MTALHLGVVSDNYRIVKRLINKGADRMIKDKNGRTPLELAQANH